ncbi:MAG: geranylgeranylglycerol-phosphate geranylgeranyltransferase [Fibromonadaceae bacterium]|jgi:geranylgeranylglycerol-phosphate geranylgeranyltransferase|nr:geranylgeranylglycerol-phosphate geranylgeranyltransferase [Fibromonadaceae bacterium]
MHKSTLRDSEAQKETFRSRKKTYQPSAVHQRDTKREGSSQLSTLNSQLAFFVLCRVWNSLFAAGVCVYSFYIAKSDFHEAVWLSVGVFFLLSFANAHNDIVDFEVDKINRPKRPLPSGKISLKRAFLVAFACFFLAVIFGFELAWLFVLVGVLCFIYNKFLKGLPLVGNFAVALLTTTPIVIPLLKFNQAELLHLSFFAFMLTFAREITKDIEDMEGDKALGLKTFPVLLGINLSLTLVIICELKCLAMLALFKPVVIFGVFPGLLLSVIFALLKKWRFSQNMIKITMIAGLFGWGIF